MQVDDVAESLGITEEGARYYFRNGRLGWWDVKLQRYLCTPKQFRAFMKTKRRGRLPLNQKKVNKIRRCLERGLTIRETAKVCDVSPRTVQKYKTK